VPFYPDSIASDDGGSVGAQSGCDIDCRPGNQMIVVGVIFFVGCRSVAMVLYAGSTGPFIYLLQRLKR